MGIQNTTGDVHGPSVQGPVNGEVTTTNEATSTEVRTVAFEGTVTVHQGGNTGGIHQSF
jgi:hypothetical protein